MKIGSLFSGYGGLDKACEAAFEAETRWVSDIDPGACKILAHRYPDLPNHGDITKIDWAAVEPVDILTGGFPCQDVSHAGKRAGLRPDTRSGLWSQMAYAVEQLRPRYVVAENVRGLLSAEAHSSLEPCPWCLGGSGDGEPDLRALGCVLGDLAELGYDAQWVGLRAADVGAPHGRFRVFVLATDTRRPDWRREDPTGSAPGGLDVATGGRHQGASSLAGDRGDGAAQDANLAARGERRQSAPGQAEGGRTRTDTGGRDRAPAANASGERHGRGEDRREVGRMDDGAEGEARQRERARAESGDRGATDWGTYEPAIRRWERALGRVAPAPTETSSKGGERLSARLVEWMMGLPDGWVTDVPDLNRNAQLKALGNGVVPQQAYAAISRMLSASAVAA